jgi:hypothetical protein
MTMFRKPANDDGKLIRPRLNLSDAQWRRLRR